MYLYHYCNLEKFESIINSKALWLTRIVKSNDTEEVKRTFKIIWENIREKVRNDLLKDGVSDDVINILDKQLELEIYLSENEQEEPYGICFTENRDFSQNWNEYGDHGKGIALGFSNDIFYGIKNQLPHPNACFSMSIGWEKVIYDTINLHENFRKLISQILKTEQTAMGWLIVRTTLKHYSAFIKNPTYCDEREVRIIYYPQESHKFPNKPELSNKVDTPVPHYSLPWIKKDGKCALKEIIIGTNCKYSESDIKKFLCDNGINDTIKISKSEYPYRKSDNK